MKRLVLIALLAMCVSAVSFAQGPPSPEEQIAALKTSLTLNDDQVAKVTAIYQARTKSLDSLRYATTGNDMQAMFAKIMPIFNAANTKVKTILTPEQAVIFQKQVDEQNEMFKKIQQGQN